MFRPPPLPGQAEENDRHRWSALVWAQVQANGSREWRVARRIDGSEQQGAKQWITAQGAISFPYHLKACLPNQITFDLGDLQPGDPPEGNWARTAEWANAIGDACTSLHIPFLKAPSSGKGVHIEVYLDPTEKWASRIDMAGSCGNCYHPENLHSVGESCRVGRGFAFAISRYFVAPVEMWDYDELSVRSIPTPSFRHGECNCSKFERVDAGEDVRWQIARRILAEAHLILWGDNDEMRRIVYDRIFIAPNEGSYLLTEFGERKQAGTLKRKLLWHEGHGPAQHLPATQVEAYRLAETMAKVRGSPRPSSIPVAIGACAFDTHWVKGMAGRNCPQGPQCYDNEGWPTCDDCPAGA